MTRKAVPVPPALHWSLVLLLAICTAGLFADGWMIVQAVWAKKFDSASKAVALSVVSIAVSVLGLLLNALHAGSGIEAVVLIAGIALEITASFSVRDSLRQYVRNVTGKPSYLSGLMTILFGPIYLQFHMNKVRSYLRHHADAAAR